MENKAEPVRENKKTSSRIPEFEALRALAIILLLPLHSGIFDFHVFGIYLGPFGTFIGAFLLGSFFFLAGYFSPMSFQKPNETYSSFIWSKVIRLFPPYWLALGLYVFVLDYSLRKRDLLIYALNLQFLFSPAFAKQVLTLWYISIVFIYFVFFGFLLSRRVSQKVFLICSVLLLGVSCLIHLRTNLFDGRFFEYFFIFMAGIYFSQFPNIREKLYSLHVAAKAVLAMIGTGLFWYVQSAGLEFFSWGYLAAVDFYILAMILFWIEIFRTPIGRWKVWGFISYASFFAYLLHRPIWHILEFLFVFDTWEKNVLFIVFPGSVVVFLVSYVFQSLYDRLLLFVRPVSKV